MKRTQLHLQNSYSNYKQLHLGTHNCVILNNHSFSYHHRCKGSFNSFIIFIKTKCCMYTLKTNPKTLKRYSVFPPFNEFFIMNLDHILNFSLHNWRPHHHQFFSPHENSSVFICIPKHIFYKYIIIEPKETLCVGWWGPLLNALRSS